MSCPGGEAKSIKQAKTHAFLHLEKGRFATFSELPQENHMAAAGNMETPGGHFELKKLKKRDHVKSLHVTAMSRVLRQPNPNHGMVSQFSHVFSSKDL